MFVLIINNLTASPLSYLSGAVTVPSLGSTTITDPYKLALSTDGQLRLDCLTNVVTISDGVNTFGGNDAIAYLRLIPTILSANGAPVGSLTIAYNEVTAVISGIETSILVYTAPSGKTSYLQYIETGGTNVAEYRIYRVSSVFDKKYSSFTEYNVQFDYRSNESTSPGYEITAGDTVEIRVLHNRPTTGNFNGKIQVFEIG